MREILNLLLTRGLPGLGPEFFRAHEWLALVLAALVAWAVPVLFLVLPLAGVSTYVER